MVRKFYEYVSKNIAGMLGISAYIFIDTLFISISGGADGITVLNLVLPLFGIIYAIGNMIGVGSAIKYAIQKARGEKNVEYYFSHALQWQMLISLPFLILGILNPKLWLTLMGGDPQIAEIGQGYVRIILIGTPCFMLNGSFVAFARNDNAPTIAMVGVMVASCLNIIGDYIFMFPLGMGISGAALATVISPLISCMICGSHFLGGKSNISFNFVPLSFHRIISCCKLGISAFVGEISSAVTTTVFNFLILGIVGNIGVAAYGVVANLALVSLAIFNGIAQGAQPLISKSYGEGKKNEVRKFIELSIITGILIEFIILIFVYGATDTLVNIFNSGGNMELEKYANVALRLYFLGYIAAGINVILITCFTAMEKVLIATIASLMRGMIAITFSAIVLSNIFGLNGVWLSFLASEVMTLMVIMVWYFIYRKRRGAGNENTL